MRAIHRHPIVFSLLLLGIAGGCGGTQSCGCGATPLAHDLAPTDKVTDGIQAEISPAGFTYIQNNFSGIMSTFLPGGLHFSMPADPGGCSCNGQSICHQGSPCQISAKLTNVVIGRKAPNVLNLSANLTVYSGSSASGPAQNIPVEVCHKVLFCFKPSCNLTVHAVNKPINVAITFGRDPVTNAITYTVGDPSVSISSGDYGIGGALYCDAASLLLKGFITNLINNQLKSQVSGVIRKQVESMTCMPCNYFTQGCKNGLDPSTFCGADPITGAQVCLHKNSAGQSVCVHKPLGLVGKVDLGTALASVLPGVKAPVNLYLGLGQAKDPSVDSIIPADGGPLDLRMITGTSVDTTNPCVPPASTKPDTSTPPRIDFATEAGSTPYMVGLGVSDNFLNKMFYSLYRSGGMCLDVGSSTSSFLSTGLFATFLPSLSSLTEGKNAPMLIALRPKDRPTVDIGKGTYHTDPSGKIVLDQPLLTIHMKNVHLDFYAQVDQRYVRLFTLSADLDLPLGLDFTPGGKAIPILGNLSNLVSNIQTSNSKILAEDPATLAKLIPSLIGLIQPALAGALKPIALPAIQGFVLKVNKIAGIVPMSPATTPATFNHLGIFASLALQSAPPSTSSVQTEARIDSVLVPQRAPGAAGSLETPTVVLDVAAFDASRASPGEEWQYRVDGGFWSPFQRVSQLAIRSPLFLLQGNHRIDVRAREIGHYRTLDPTPATVHALIDWTPPTGRLSVDAATGEVVVHGHDLVTPAKDLEYAFSVDGGPFTGFSTDATMTLPVDAHRLVAEVRDQAGNVTRLSWRAPTFGQAVAPGPADAGTGCAVAGTGQSAGSLVLLLMGLALALVRRRR